MKCPNCLTPLLRKYDNLRKIVDYCSKCNFITSPSGIKIDKIFVVVAVDKDGNEGIPAITVENGMLMPLVGADEARINNFRSIIPQLEASGVKCKILKFTHFEEIK